MVSSVIEVEDGSGPPVGVICLEPEAQAQNEMPDGNRIVVSMIYGEPHFSEAARCSYDVVLVQPEHILGIELFSSPSPSISDIAGLIKRAFIHIDHNLALSELLRVEDSRQLPFLLRWDRVGPDLGPVDSFVCQALKSEQLTNRREA